MRIGVTGASGMLGTALIDELTNKHQVFATSRGKGYEKEGVQWECFDLTNLKKLDRWLVNTTPDVVVHCAAMVNVDKCENNVEFAKKLHIDTTSAIANYLNQDSKKLIYISTDSVFDGKKNEPYIESDQANPLNIYAETKLLGEKPVLLMESGLVLRTNIIGWSKSDKMSFAEWVLTGLVESKPLNLFTDVMFSPLHVSDLSIITNQAIENEISGLYHCTSKDCVSKYDFGIKMAEIFDFPIDNIKSISVEGIDFEANRPKNMALCSEKLNSILKYDPLIVSDAIKLMKNQYDNGWLSRIKGVELENNYNFWRNR
jgi:dTDP-4-dehydrorhamnose reductase